VWNGFDLIISDLGVVILQLKKEKKGKGVV